MKLNRRSLRTCVLVVTIVLLEVQWSACRPRISASDIKSGINLNSEIDPKLLNAIKTSKNIEEFARHDDLKEYRKNAILMVESQSIQVASSQHPRVIMFSNDYKTLLSYESSPQQSTHGQVEMIKYDDSTNQYNFFEANLNEKSSIESMDGTDRCSSCHHGTPIWEPYDFWPGSMPKASVCRNDVEKQYFEGNHLKENPLLNLLNIGCLTSNGLRLADGLRNGHHFAFVSKKIQKHKNYNQFKFAIAGAMIDCPNISEFDPGLTGQNPQRLTQIASKIKDSLSKMDQDMYELLERDSNGVTANVASNLAYFLEARDFSFPGLFMSNQSEYFISPLIGQIQTLAYSFLGTDPDLAQLPVYRTWKGNTSTIFGITKKNEFLKAKKSSDEVEQVTFRDWGVNEYLQAPNHQEKIASHPAMQSACSTLKLLSQKALSGTSTAQLINAYKKW